MTTMQWSNDIAPSAAAGWYAAMREWEPPEGPSPAAFFWSGSEWEHVRGTLHCVAGPFGDERSALYWAIDNDPEI